MSTASLIPAAITSVLFLFGVWLGRRQGCAAERDHAAKEAARRKWAPILAHEEKFADMPRISRGPLPTPPGHPDRSAQ